MLSYRRVLPALASPLTAAIVLACSFDVSGVGDPPIPSAARAPGGGGGGGSIAIQDLGTLPTDRTQGRSAIASALNTGQTRAAVKVAGSSSSGCCVGEGLMTWTAATGMTAQPMLPGFTVSWAKGVSAAGYVVGEMTGSSASGNRAFVLSPNGAISALPLLAGATDASADGISASGTFIVGSNWSVGVDGSTTRHAVVWRGLGASVQSLGPGAGRGISEDSVVAGIARLAGVTVAAVWTKGAAEWTMTPLASAASEATDINPAGTAVAGRVGSAPAVWRRSATGWTLTTLPRLVTDDPASFAVGVDNAGRVVGVSGDRGVLWTPTGGGGYTIQALPRLGSFGSTWAAAINEAGQIVGRSAAPAKQGGGLHAVLWTLP